MYATLASRDVDCCLIPESPFYLEGKGGLYDFIEQRLTKNSHIVTVVAEGAGQELITEIMRSMDHEDASGNKLLLVLSAWLLGRQEFFCHHRGLIRLQLCFLHVRHHILFYSARFTSAATASVYWIPSILCFDDFTVSTATTPASATPDGMTSFGISRGAMPLKWMFSAPASIQVFSAPAPASFRCSALLHRLLSGCSALLRLLLLIGCSSPSGGVLVRFATWSCYFGVCYFEIARLQRYHHCRKRLLQFGSATAAILLWHYYLEDYCY